jgi:RHS repeat-associated protein
VNGIARKYDYDAFGNRTACTQIGPDDCQGFLINAVENRNRLAGTGYDAAGNVTGLSGHVYSYDPLNMMTRDSFGQLSREFVYTADDERIATYTVGSSWSWTIRGTDGKVLRELTSSDGPAGPGTSGWQWTKDHVWRNGLLLASRQPDGANTTTYHYHLDHLGTPRRVTDQNDRIVGVHDYLAFGPELSGGAAEPSATTLKYTGHERDNWSSGSSDALDYMHARYYSPWMGRFLSVDSHDGTPTLPQTWNRYQYTRNNPVRLFDPDGHKELEFTIRHFIPAPTVLLPYGRNRGDGRTFSLRSDANVRTERTIRIETDPSKNSSGRVSINDPRIGPSENFWFGLKGRASGASMTAEVKRIPGFGVLITATQNEAEPLPMSLAEPQAAQFFTGRGGIRSTVNIFVNEDGSQISVFGSRSAFPAMEINASDDEETFAIFRGDASSIPFGFGIFDTEGIDRQCTEGSNGYTCQ